MTSTITTPIAPLEFDLRARPFADGFARALADLLGIAVNVGVRRRAGLLQTLVDFNGLLDEAAPHDGHIEDFKKRWLADVRPPTLQILEAIRAAADAPLVDQINSLGEIAAGVEEITFLHHTLLLPARAALAEFVHFTRIESLVDDDLDALSLLAGHGNASTEAARRLWRLRGMANERPRADRLLIDTLETVAQEGEGYGMTEPCWLEDAAVPFAIADAYTAVPLIYGPAVRLGLADERRAALNKQVRHRLAGYGAIADYYERHLARARSALAVTEDHAPIMHARLAFALRAFALRLGANLAEIGRLADPLAVLDLHVDGLATSHRTGQLTNGQGRNGSRDLATGEPQSVPSRPPGRSALLDYIQQVFGPRSPRSDERAAGPASLRGEPGAGGKASGPARRLCRHIDLRSIQPGDVVIAPDNSSIWSFGLPLAAAVVAPGGSRYGHLASLARDYVRPAVVGLSQTVLDDIEEGDQLHVDGRSGLVEVGHTEARRP